MIGGVIIPIGVVLLYDLVVFSIIMRQLSKKVAGKQVIKSKREERVRRLQNAIALIILMGLTWGVGFMVIIEATSEVFEVIFIMNSLQGVFLFMFYCVRNPMVRTKWRNALCCCLTPRHDYISSVSTSGNVNTNSRSHTQTGKNRNEYRDDDSNEDSNEDVDSPALLGNGNPRHAKDIPDFRAVNPYLDTSAPYNVYNGESWEPNPYTIPRPKIKIY